MLLLPEGKQLFPLLLEFAQVEVPLLEAEALALEAVAVVAVLEAEAQLDSLDSQDCSHWLDLSHSLRTCSVSLSKILPAAARKDLDMLKFAAALYIPRTHFDMLLAFLGLFRGTLAELLGNFY